MLSGTKKFTRRQYRTKFSILEANIYENDASIRKYLERILDQVNIESVTLKNGQIDSTTALGKLNDQMTQLVSFHKELATALAQAADQERVASIQHNIEAGAQLTELFGKIAFSHDPATAYRINTGARAIATIASGAVRLSHSTLDTGAKLLAGLSMGNAALSIVSMFGPFGQDQTTAMLEAGFSSVRSDIHTLSMAMNEQFAVVEKGMKIIYDNMNDRFDKLDQEYERLDSRVDQLSNEVKLYYGVTSAALGAALRQPYWVSYKLCTAPGIEAFLSAADLIEKCLAQITVFASQVADQQVLTGQVLFDYRLPSEEASPLLDQQPSQYQMGFLQSSLINSGARSRNLPSSLSASSPSPYVWASAVDTYFFELGLGPKLVAPVSQTTLAAVSANNTTDIIRAGERTLGTINALRRSGVDVALQIYREKASDLANKLSAAATTELITRDLGITKVVDYRNAAFSFYDNDDFKIELQRGTQVAVVQGPHQTNLPIQRYRRFVLPPLSLRGGDAANRIDRWSNSAMTQWIYDDQQYPLNKYEPIEIATSDKDSAESLSKANEAYLADVPYSQLTPEAVNLLEKEWSRLTVTNTDLDLGRACVALSTARLYVMELAVFGRTEMSLDEQWVQPLERLPGAASSASIQTDCNEVLAVLRDSLASAKPSGAQTVNRYIAGWVENILLSRVDAFANAYKLAAFEGDVPEVEMRVKRLQVLPQTN